MGWGRKGMALKAAIARWLRRSRLLGLADNMLAQAEYVRGYRARRAFRRGNPDFVLPPTALAYDAFGPWNPEIYRMQGRDHAAYIASLIKRYHGRAGVICEWGCGRMRVLRHMPNHFPGSFLIGLDYNPKTISWCTQHFTGFRFGLNRLEPPLPLKDGEADVIYAISVFTHLSARQHMEYAADLMRCLSSGGILIVTLHCDAYIPKLTGDELKQYQSGGLVVREGVIEGSRAYVAFHSPSFVRELFAGFQVLEHDSVERVAGFQQDTWVLAKRDQPLVGA